MSLIPPPFNQYLTAVKDVLILIGVGLVLWFVWRAGTDHVGKKELSDLQAQISAQGKQVAVWRQESNDAQTKLSQDMQRINTAASTPVIHRWVCQQPSPKSSVLPPASGKAGPVISSGGGFQSGTGAVPGNDWRDLATAAFKQRWETVLAECRAEDNQWPK
jgi:hypothetical protein